MKNIAFAVLALLFFLPSQGQGQVLDEYLNRWKLSAFGGLTSSIPVGEKVTLLKEAEAQFINGLLPSSEFEMEILPLWSAHGGVEFQMPVSSSLSGLLGGSISRRGYVQSYSFTYRDPIYQYDEIRTENLRTIIQMLDLIMGLRLRVGKDTYLSAGLTHSWLLSKEGAFMEHIVTSKTIINGEITSDEQLDFTPEENFLSEVIAPTGVSAFLQLHLPIMDHLHAYVGGQITSSIMKDGPGLNAVQIQLGARYIFFEK